MRFRFTALIILLTFSLIALADEGPDLERIMSDPDWIGNAPSEAWWSDDGQSVYYLQKREGEKFNDLYRVAASGGQAVLVEAHEESASSNESRVYNADRTAVAWVQRGDVWLRDLQSGDTRQISRTTTGESRPMFMADGRQVAYLADGRYHVFDPASGLTREVADLKFEKDPDADPAFNTLREQQMRVFETLRREKRRDEASSDHQENRQGADPSGAPLPIWLGDEYEELNRTLSPSGHHMLVSVKKKGAESGKSGRMPNYVTEDGYLAITDTRTRVGLDEPPAQSMLLINLEDRSFSKVDVSELPGIDEDPLADLRGPAIEWHVEHGAKREEVEKSLKAPEQRSVWVMDVEWNAQGTLAAIQLRAGDNKDRWLTTLDPVSGDLQVQHRLTDAAWVNWDYNEYGWMPDGETLWYLSEESGYSHLYIKGVNDRRARQLTEGEFVVREPALAPSGNAFYVVSNRTHPGNYEVYRVAAGGGALEQVSGLGGVVAFDLSPDGEQLLLSRSYIDRHADLYVQGSAPGDVATQITDTVSDEYKAIDWVIPEIVEVPSSHVDESIYTKLYLPKDYTEGETYPAVMFVHGAGYTQNAHMGWPYYFREFMFHTLLANEGYIVIDMDYRASKGYGRDWRTAIYRQMGHPELEDFQDGVAWLVDQYGVDPERVGVYGGSYGGFMTFMALFRDPDLFAAGAALRPVADWMQYNHFYTSNILNTPQVDPEAYQRSSPINYVQNLEKPLLIAAGMQDNNVFFQDSVLVVQRLIELKKENFEIAIYPLDPHGFVHPESWLDEYRRIFKLMEANLKP